MPYNKMPTLDDWIDRVGETSNPALNWITILIARYSELCEKEKVSPPLPVGRIKKASGRRDAFGAGDAAAWWAQQKAFVLFQIEQASRFVKKYAIKRGEEKLGGLLKPEQIQAVAELHEFVYAEVKKSIGATDNADYDKKIIERFGRSVVRAEVQNDQDLLKRGALEYFLTPQGQKELKLSFRQGKAHKWTFDAQKKKGTMYLYDTQGFGDANEFEFGGSLYVMNRKGAIYVYGKQKEKELKHSSLLAGAGVLCAGTIRIENGDVKWITGRSGHYKPKVEHLVSLLLRLKLYQVDLENVLVFRENFTNTFNNGKGYPGKYFEPCDALELVLLGAWPGPKEYSNSMRVG